MSTKIILKFNQITCHRLVYSARTSIKQSLQVHSIFVFDVKVHNTSQFQQFIQICMQLQYNKKNEQQHTFVIDYCANDFCSLILLQVSLYLHETITYRLIQDVTLAELKMLGSPIKSMILSAQGVDNEVHMHTRSEQPHTSLLITWQCN